MKTVFTLLFSFILSLTLSAQNGGQMNENNSTKIEHIGYDNNQIIVRVTNKQSCAADMRITYGSESRVKLIQGLQSDTFKIVSPANSKVRAKTETNCGSADFGQVEITVNSTLPVKFEYFKVTKLEGRQIQIEFKASDAVGEDRFNIQVSEDGKTFRTVAVVLPYPIQENQLYKIKITL